VRLRPQGGSALKPGRDGFNSKDPYGVVFLKGGKISLLSFQNIFLTT